MGSDGETRLAFPISTRCSAVLRLYQSGGYCDSTALPQGFIGAHQQEESRRGGADACCDSVRFRHVRISGRGIIGGFAESLHRSKDLHQSSVRLIFPFHSSTRLTLVDRSIIVSEIFTKALRRKDQAGKSAEEVGLDGKGTEIIKEKTEDELEKANSGKIMNLISVDTFRVCPLRSDRGIELTIVCWSSCPKLLVICTSSTLNYRSPSSYVCSRASFDQALIRLF